MNLVRFLVLVFLCLAAVGALAQQPAAAPRPITIADYFQIHEVHGPQISPDGRWIAYAVRTPNLDEDKNESRIWMVSSAGGDAIALTAEGDSSSHPRWSPVGKWLAFLSARDEGKTQVWLLNRLGGRFGHPTEGHYEILQARQLARRSYGRPILERPGLVRLKKTQPFERSQVYKSYIHKPADQVFLRRSSWLNQDAAY
jgi:dipeptidyl aminopeptidase/acylaminoacyl peptidase